MQRSTSILAIKRMQTKVMRTIRFNRPKVLHHMNLLFLLSQLITFTYTSKDVDTLGASIG